MLKTAATIVQTLSAILLHAPGGLHGLRCLNGSCGRYGLITGIALLLATGCSTLTTTAAISVDAQQSWVLLPINNLSETPQADVQGQTLIETKLRAHGVKRLAVYVPSQPVSLRTLLDPDTQIDEGLKWARAAGHRYALSGTISEWHYKSGADKEPVVGMNLKLLDLASGEVVWQANAARTGWGYASLPAVADKVIEDLLAGLRFDDVKH
jgi:PBP1b-binding outer membrane lipoprotein LpoB